MKREGNSNSNAELHLNITQRFTKCNSEFLSGVLAVSFCYQFLIQFQPEVCHNCSMNSLFLSKLCLQNHPAVIRYLHIEFIPVCNYVKITESWNTNYSRSKLSTYVHWLQHYLFQSFVQHKKINREGLKERTQKAFASQFSTQLFFLKLFHLLYSYHLYKSTYLVSGAYMVSYFSLTQMLTTIQYVKTCKHVHI